MYSIKGCISPFRSVFEHPLQTENYRPVRQWTVKSETTKQKAGALPPAAYTVHITLSSGLKRDFDSLKKTMHHQRLRYHNAVSAQFVDEGDVTEAFEDHREEQIDEYETDSNDEESDFEEHAERVRRELFVHLCVSTCDGKGYS